MDRTNSKIITLSFAIFAFLVALSINLLLNAFAGAFGVIAKLRDIDLVRHGLPVAIGLVLFSLLQFNTKRWNWADEVVGEVRKITWPSRKDTTAMTIVVVVMVFISSLVISGFDLLSTLIINNFLR